ncbi:MAG: hypothetical protein QW404_00665 [Candidatus Nanoarchaeia archaeon]
MYAYPYRVSGKFTVGDLMDEVNKLLLSYGFKQIFLDPGKTKDGDQLKIYSFYEKKGLAAFTAFTPNGNHLKYNDNLYKDYLCAGWVGLVGLLEIPEHLDENTKKLTRSLEQLMFKYDAELNFAFKKSLEKPMLS